MVKLVVYMQIIIKSSGCIKDTDLKRTYKWIKSHNSFFFWHRLTTLRKRENAYMIQEFNFYRKKLCVVLWSFLRKCARLLNLDISIGISSTYRVIVKVAEDPTATGEYWTNHKWLLTLLWRLKYLTFVKFPNASRTESKRKISSSVCNRDNQKPI